MADDLLSSILQALMPATGMEQPMGLGGPERFSSNGAMNGPSVRPPITPPPGMSVQNQPLPVSDEIAKIFAPAYQQPTSAPVPGPRPMPRPAVAAPRPPVQQEMPDGATDNRITGADVQRFIRSVATGAGRADPRAPAAAAVAQGAMGALQNSYGEVQREKALKLNERRADIADRRADTALDAQLRRDYRAEQEHARKVKRDEDVNRERLVRTEERLKRIAQLEDKRLRPQDLSNLRRDSLSRAAQLTREVREGYKTKEEAERELDEWQRNEVEKLIKRDPAAKAPPAAGAKPPAGPGTGARDMPFSFEGLDRDAAQRRFNELKKGQFYVNPADGKIYEKK